ncbi:hypothetical protein ES704_01106 [subsurface metagenome]|jgi:hypothetical protein
MNEVVNWRTEILSILEQIKSIGANADILKKLFIEKLNFEPTDQDVLIEFPKNVKDKILSIKIISKVDNFKVIFCIIDSLLKGIEREAVKSISRQYPENIIIFTNKENNEAHFINTKYIGKDKERKARGFRRITVGKTDRLRTAAERLSNIYADDRISTLTLTSKCEEAFDVEAVSKEFYREFVEKYKELRDVIKNNNPLLKNGIADELTQEIMNRLLFLYFIQKKGWLNGDYKFLYNNFKLNQKNYYKNFLIPLFKKLSIKDSNHPDFKNIPFLNGGLFEFEQEIEEKVTIPNQAFDDIFEDLLERFNFTIREDTEFEEEVAIDPEMLGKIFEELILSIEAEKYKDIPDPRRASGSYYTPRFIVSFMTKQSLLNYLINELPEIPEEIFKSFIYKLSTHGIGRPEIIKKKLLNLKIVDPGVGSGAFSVDILNKLVNLIETLNNEIGITESRYNLRKKIIEDCIYGVDIQSRAVHLARLRLWLSLIVDLEVENIKDIPPLINLDFKILKGDSLVSKICGFKFDLKRRTLTNQKIFELIEKYKKSKDEFSEVDIDVKKQILKDKIIKIKCDIAIWYLENMQYSLKDKLKSIGSQLTLIEKTKKEIKEEERKKETLTQEISSLEKEIEEIKKGQDIDTFNWYLDFFEVMGAKEGFDIVIANPPYGISVAEEIFKNEFNLGSSDSYGAFTALGLNILRPGGTLCYIMSDTWQTIMTHYKLRKKMFEETKAQYLISVPMKTFKATVNTGIYLFKKSSPEEEKDNLVIAADFHGLDIKNGDLEAALDLIVDIKPDEKCKEGYTIISDKEMAIYAYWQKIISKFSNLSFFIASPKLFKLMDDTSNIVLSAPPIMKVNFNGREIKLMKLGDIAEIREGMTTGDNNYYLRQLPNTKGSNYQEVDLNLVLKESQLEKIKENEELRLNVIENGICTNPEHNTHRNRYFGGRYFIPYDKGGASDIEEGWLPNYYVPTPYFIDWSENSRRMMKTMTIEDRKRYCKEYGKIKKGDGNKVANVFRNSHMYFNNDLTLSFTGYYSPTFRSSAATIFDVAGKNIKLQNRINNSLFLGILCSKLIKYIAKNFLDHTVNFQIEEIKKIIILNNIPSMIKIRIIPYINSIIHHQKQNPKYDYMTNEQLEIDELVYKMYNLDKEDIKEAENWYFRRYPKLAKVIEGKIKKKNKGE